ncbi:hypothetical protein L6471_03990 [Segatella bryantii]|uniref:hypothetical protein n=1 Tax=Segatella bryantii TaxID=77095 RepID=UPI001ED9E2A3|nr:hypothetical protein [Segatella bryantii]UKK74872.1 hypothetical protein L6471_03990 [Segatella bryantii]
MNDLISNPWIVGIGGGVISSLIVFFITKFFLSKKENKEYEQKVRLATNEVVYAVRPIVIDKAIPANDILAALRSAIAVKYGVKVSDVIGIKQLVCILVLEILSNSFLNSSQKNEYCNLLMTMKDEPKQTPSNDVHKRKSERNLYISMMLSLLSFIAVLEIVLASKEKNVENVEVYKQGFFLIISALMFILGFTTFTLYILKERLKNRKIELDKLKLKLDEYETGAK